MPTRRAMLAACAGIALAPCAGIAQAPRVAAAEGAIVTRQAALADARSRPDSLAAHAARLGLPFGTFVDGVGMKDDAYLNVVARELSMIYPWGMSTNVTRRSRTGFDFSRADAITSFASAHELTLGGGYLVVHGTEPGWIRPDTDRAAALAEMQLDITTTMQRYARRLDHWVIVNEALYLGDGNPYGLRSCTWRSTIGGDVGAGTDYVSEAFRAARRADPSAVLVLNEYGVEDDTRDAAKKRDALLALLQSLRDRKLIDAIGLQSHLRGGVPFSAPVFDEFLARIDALGLKIVVTELDVIDADLPAQSATRDATVAARAADYLRVVLAHRSLSAINTWALSDRETWYNQPGTLASLRRRDGLDSRPTLFDAGLNGKPVYYAVRDALDKAASP